GLAGRMEGIAQADEPARAGLVRHHARDAPSERLASDRDTLSASESSDRREPALLENRLPVRGAPPSLPHVRALDTGHSKPAGRHAARDRREKGRAHRRARSVRERERQGRIGRPVEEELRGLHFPPRIIVRAAWSAGTTSARLSALLHDLRLRAEDL